MKAQTSSTTSAGVLLDLEPGPVEVIYILLFLS